MAHAYGIAYHDLIKWTPRETYVACEHITRREHNERAQFWNVYGKLKGAKQNVIPYKRVRPIETPDKKAENEVADEAIKKVFSSRTGDGKGHN